MCAVCGEEVRNTKINTNQQVCWNSPSRICNALLRAGFFDKGEFFVSKGVKKRYKHLFD